MSDVQIGDRVSFYWPPARRRWSGTVVDRITFAGQVRLGVSVSEPTDIDPKGFQVGGRVYDVWPNSHDVTAIKKEEGERQ